MFRIWSLIIVVTAVLVALLGLKYCPCFTYDPDADMGAQASRNQMRQIAYALRSYVESKKRLPPAVVASDEGTPLYSWRVLMLPYLEQPVLFDQFRLNEAWDSPHNRQFLEKTPTCYARSGPEIPSGKTPYLAVVGPGTAFEKRGMKWELFTDGVDQTALVVEAATPVFWSQPVDWIFDPKGPVKPLLSESYKAERQWCRYVFPRGFNVAFADGKVRLIPKEVDEQTLRALITRNGGEKIDWSKIDR